MQYIPYTLYGQIEPLLAPTFAYVWVSTVGQTAENQVQEITAACFAIEPHRIIAGTVSGSVAALARKGFARLLDRLEKGDVLIVTKLGLLWRDAIGFGTTVRQLDDKGGWFTSLLAELTSPARPVV
ncbi:MAG: recombinase family protein [Sphingomonas pseudosanguinis]